MLASDDYVDVAKIVRVSFSCYVSAGTDAVAAGSSASSSSFLATTASLPHFIPVAETFAVANCQISARAHYRYGLVPALMEQTMIEAICRATFDGMTHR